MPHVDLPASRNVPRGTFNGTIAEAPPFRSAGVPPTGFLKRGYSATSDVQLFRVKHSNGCRFRP
jgi:hypothetical protein